MGALAAKSNLGAHVERAPTQRPSITFTQMHKALDKTEIYSVHPEVLVILDRNYGDLCHVEAVRDRNAACFPGEKQQTEFLLVKFPKVMTLREIGDAADILHIVRRKADGVTPGKVHGLSEKGYMLVTEPDAVEILRKIMPKKIIEAGGVSARIG